MTSSTSELHSYGCKGQKCLEGKMEGRGSHICMKRHWALLTKVSDRKKERTKLCSMRETWESCESLTTAVGNLEVLMMKKMEGLYDKFSMHLTVMFTRWTRKSALREPQTLYKMVMWGFTMLSEECGRRRELITEGGAPYLIRRYWSLGLALECLLSSQTLILCLLWRCLLHRFSDLHFLMPHLFHWHIQFCCICLGKCFLVFKSYAAFPPQASLPLVTAVTRKTNNYSENRNLVRASRWCLCLPVGLSPHSQHLIDSQETYLTWVTSLVGMNSGVQRKSNCFSITPSGYWAPFSPNGRKQNLSFFWEGAIIFRLKIIHDSFYLFKVSSEYT